MRRISIRVSMGAAVLGLCGEGRAADPWPAEPWTAAQVLTNLDPDFSNNISGACYNPVTKTFWVCRNGGPSAFWALQAAEGGDWAVASKGPARAKYQVAKGDFEGICQVDYQKERVYLMVEKAGKIREYDTARFGHPTLVNEWDLSDYLPTKGNEGPEGITFVPDAWLKKGAFTDASGHAYLSKGGMGGLMLVAHQNGGSIYAFDLHVGSKKVQYVGTYKTAKKESAGLEFDRSFGLLYIWHNTGKNHLEVVTLASHAEGNERHFASVRNFYGPRKGNLEGFAISPAAEEGGVCLIVDDNNKDGAALMLYQEFDFTSLLKSE